MRATFALLSAAALVACDDGGGDPDDPPPAWRTAFAAEEQGAFLSVWGPSADDVWAVGGQPGTGVAWHRGAEGWARAEVPEGPLLNWVFGVDDELWIVGNDGRALRRVGGGPFEATSTGVEHPLWGVWGAARDDVWTVGGDAARTEDPDPVLLHWDGAAWTRVEIPALDRKLPALFKVWGTSASQVFAVGSNGVVLRYDGAGWTQTLTGTARDLISLWGRAADDVVAVGGRAVGVVARWDGAAWTSQTFRTPGLNGVWMAPDGVATLVGDRGYLLRLAPGGEPERESVAARELLHGVWGDGAGYRVAVGGSLLHSPPWTGVAIESGP